MNNRRAPFKSGSLNESRMQCEDGYHEIQNGFLLYIQQKEAGKLSVTKHDILPKLMRNYRESQLNGGM